MLYIVDTYAWVEYLIGSKKGSILKKLREDDSNGFLTVECCLAELKVGAIAMARISRGSMISSDPTLSS